jgi:uncharacterized protein
MKRILSLDGGGVRGILTLGMLKKIESLLKTKGLKITQYFDLIGGTSTGAITASGLAIGKSVEELIDLYMDLGSKIFGKKIPWYLKDSWEMPRAFLKENYSSDKLEE